MWRFFVLFTISSIFIHCQNGTKNNGNKRNAIFLSENVNQLDSLVNTISIDDKIKQSLIVKIDATTPKSTIDSLVKNGLGGIWFEDMHMDSIQQRILDFKQLSPFPLLYGANRISPFYNLSNNTLSAVQNEALLIQYWERKQSILNHIGINFTFIDAPIQTDTVYDFQNYTTWKEDATNRVSQQIELLQSNYILTGVSNIVTSKQDTMLADSIFNWLDIPIELGLSAATLQVGQSKAAIQTLRDSLKFDGLLFDHSSSLNQAFSNNADLIAIDYKKVPTILNSILKKFETQDDANTYFDKKIRTIITAKTWTDNAFSPDSLPPLDLTDELLYRQLLANSMTIVKDPQKKIPLKTRFNKPLKITSIGEKQTTSFTNRIKDYADCNYKHIDKIDRRSNLLHEEIIILNDVILNSFEDDIAQNINGKLGKGHQIIVNLGSPSNLQYLNPLNLRHITIVQCAETSNLAQDFVAQMIMGGMAATGQFTQQIPNYKYGQHVAQIATRLQYNLPESVNMNTNILQKIDDIAREAISKKATPGLQVLIAKSGNVVLHKAYGYHTYRKKQAVTKDDIYDLASVTKVSATTLATMHLYDNSQINLSNKLIDYVPSNKKSKVNNIKIKNILLHESGLPPMMPVVRYIRPERKFEGKRYQYTKSSRSKDYDVKIMDKMYLKRSWQDVIWKDIYESEVKNKSYRYSDINFNLMQQVVENITEQSLDTFLYEKFYHPLNMRYTGYLPSTRFDKKQIIPTEKDTKWRKKLVQGYVHDESAALLGGIAGNAGLFSTANDLAILYQMLLNKGEYGGQTYLSPETVTYFTEENHNSKRGLGWDKAARPNAVVSSLAPKNTYGHTGFTGICVWIDPDNELIYIFLSNRVYPQRNPRLSNLEIRQRIHSVIYESMTDRVPAY